jgi:hypothetical protein
MRSIDDTGFSGSGSKPRPVRAALPWRMPKPVFVVFLDWHVSSVEEQRQKPQVAGSTPVRAAIG